KFVDSEVDRAIVAAVVELAKNLGSDVVAEKVENEETITQLRKLGVTYGQGFHLHRPEMLDDLIQRRLSLLSNFERASSLDWLQKVAG
ncbi:MAG: EAL domain-containing protein, partial [Hyphomicrobiales bacterium]